MTIDKTDGALAVEWTVLYRQGNSLQERKGETAFGYHKTTYN